MPTKTILTLLISEILSQIFYPCALLVPPLLAYLNKWHVFLNCLFGDNNSYIGGLVHDRLHINWFRNITTKSDILTMQYDGFSWYVVEAKFLLLSVHYSGNIYNFIWYVVNLRLFSDTHISIRVFNISWIFFRHLGDQIQVQLQLQVQCLSSINEHTRIKIWRSESEV